MITKEELVNLIMDHNVDEICSTLENLGIDIWNRDFYFVLNDLLLMLDK